MPLGYCHSPEAKAKIGAAQKGKIVSPETRAKISAKSLETREKMRASHLGRELSLETRAKISAANKNPSLEIRAKISEARKRQIPPMLGKKHTPEALAKISAASKTRVFTEVHRARLGAAARIRSPETRAKMSESHKGPKSYLWKGGISFAPYCPKFTKEFKERVREFFGRRCVECGAVETGKKLSVHHVNFRKDACCTEGVVPLFVPLCPVCHSKTNFNREYWESKSTTLINEQYGGQCYLPKQDWEIPELHDLEATE